MKKLSIILLMMSMLTVACAQNSKKQNIVSNSIDDVVEILYFHGKQRCATCRAIEEQTRKVVTEYNNSKVKLYVIDISLKENESIVEKYEVAWSTLILVKDNLRIDLTDMAFSYARTQPEEFCRQLKSEIKKIQQ